eukprot:3251859-Karenia_brevis.AAC.1
MVKGRSPKKQREGASSLNPREKKSKRQSEGSGEGGRHDSLMMEAAVAAAQVVLTPFKELSEEKSKEAQSLIAKAKSLSKDGVIVDWPKEVEEAAAQIKVEQEDREASRSSGLLLEGPPVCVDPGVLIPNPQFDDRDSNDEADESLPQAREHLPDGCNDEDDNRSTGTFEVESLTDGTNRLDLSGYDSPDCLGQF